MRNIPLLKSSKMVNWPQGRQPKGRRKMTARILQWIALGLLALTFLLGLFLWVAGHLDPFLFFAVSIAAGLIVRRARRGAGR